MGVTRIENIFRVRDLLLRPYPNAPSFHDLFRQELSEERDILNATNNSKIAWATAEYTLNYTPAQSAYPINVDNFGKVLFCVKVTTNPYIPLLPVGFSDVSEQSYGTILQYFNNSYAQAFTLSEAPERMSFYREGVLNAQYMVAINPLPQQSAQYIITYLPGYLGTDDPLESSIQLPEHAELVRLRMAMSLLNGASWYEDEDKNRARRKDLAMGFDYQLNIKGGGGKEKLFADYIRGINIPRMVDVEPFNWNSP